MQILTPRAIRRVPTPLWALVFAIGCVLLTVAPTSATSGTTISVGSASRQLGQTATTSVSVSLSASDALTGYDITLSYNPAIVSPTSVSFGSWTPLSTCGNQSPPNCTSGSFRVAAFQLNACSGTCALFSVSWSTVGAGNSPIQVTAQQLSGTQSGQFSGALASVGAQPGAVSVTGGVSPTVAQPTPTSPPLPTATKAPASPSPTSTSPTAPSASPESSSTTQPSQNTATPTTAPASTPETPAGSTPTQAPSNDDSNLGLPISNATQPPSDPPPPSNPAPSGSDGTGSSSNAPVPAPTAVGQPVSGVSGTGSPRPIAAATPRPPSTGSGATDYTATGNAVRFFGIALMALAAFAFASRLAMPTWQRFGSSAGDSGRASGGSEVSKSVPSAPIEDVVDQYLATVAADAARSLGSKPHEDGSSSRTDPE